MYPHLKSTYQVSMRIYVCNQNFVAVHAKVQVSKEVMHYVKIVNQIACLPSLMLNGLITKVLKRIKNLTGGRFIESLFTG